MATRSRVVWSSDDGDLRKARDPDVARARELAREGGRVKVRRETSGRRGKAVTTVSGVPLADDGLEELAGRLKKRCGVGGAVKDGVIELQGDHRDVVLEVLKDRRLRRRARRRLTRRRGLTDASAWRHGTGHEQTARRCLGIRRPGLDCAPRRGGCSGPAHRRAVVSSPDPRPARRRRDSTRREARHALSPALRARSHGRPRACPIAAVVPAVAMESGNEGSKPCAGD
jgi:translation initiation factor 1